MSKILAIKIVSAFLAGTLVFQACPLEYGSTNLLVSGTSIITARAAESALIIGEERKLTSDLSVDTDLIIRAKLDLNGHKLTVNGNLFIQGEADGWWYKGSLVLNKGTAIIGGSLNAAEQSSIVMENKADTLIVNGEAIFNGDTTLTAGTLELKGDVGGNSISSSDMHTVVFSGTGNQNISAEMNLNILDIKNSDTRTVTVDSALRVEKSTTVDGTSLHLICNESKNEQSYVSLSKLNADMLLIDGDLTFGSLDFKGSEITINGDLLGSDSITLNKTTMSVNGNAETAGDFMFNGSTVNVSGDYEHSGFLYMKNKNDKLNVGGDLHLAGTGDSIQDGIIDVKGDIRLTHVIHTYIFERYNNLGRNNKVILSGEDDVTIYMDGGNFNDIEILNSDKVTLYTDDDFAAASINCGTNPLNIVTRNGSLAIGTVTCSDFNVKGDCTITGDSTKFKCNSVMFEGDVDSWIGTLDLNGSPTTVNGTFIMNNDIILNGSEFSVEDFVMNNGALYMTKGILTVSGDMTINDGIIVMKTEKDLIDISGDLDMSRNKYHHDEEVSAGTIKCARNINSNGSFSLKTSNKLKFILTGETEQTVKISNYEIDPDCMFFANLQVLNAKNRVIVIQGNLDAGEITADSDTVKITSDGGWLTSAKLRCDLAVDGDLTVLGNTFDINGHKVVINGNLYQHEGEIAVNAGKLNVSGDYLIVCDEDSAVHSTSDGILNMTHNSDTVIVGGDFVTMTNVNHEEYITAGTLEIKGDFYQYDDGTEYAFPASGTHKVILSGKNVQNITFESYDSSHFNILEQKQDSSQYIYSDTPCWNELLQSSTIISGDANGDGEFTVADVVLLQKWLLAEPNTNLPCWQAADLCEDEKLDVFDLVMMKRKLING